MSDKNKLEDALVEIINKANNGIDSATDFLSAEIPDVIHQLLLWHGVYSFMLFAIGVLFCAVWVKLNIKQYKYVKENNLWNEPQMVANLFQTFLFLVPVLTINLEWLKIWIAPKVWLLEYASKLIN